jgi:hypothetical protein
MPITPTVDDILREISTLKEKARRWDRLMELAGMVETRAEMSAALGVELFLFHSGTRVIKVGLDEFYVEGGSYEQAIDSIPEEYN